MTVAQLILLIRNTSPYFFMNELLIALFKQGNQLTSVNAGNYAKPFIKQTWMQLS